MAVKLNGLGDSLNRTTNLPSGTKFTAMGWFYLDADQNNYTTFLSLEQSAGNDNLLTTLSDGTTLNIYAAGDNAGSALTVGRWYHLTYVLGATSQKAYINGVLDISIGASSTTPARFWVGNDGTGEWVNGRFAFIKAWDAELTPAEIAREMRAKRPVRWVNINTYLPCNPGSHGVDYSGNGFTMTEAGGPTDAMGPPEYIFSQPHPFYFLDQLEAGGTIYNRTLSDAVSVTDAPLRGVWDFRQIAEPVQTVIDRLIDGVAYGRVTHDNASVSDSMWQSIARFRAAHDNVDVSDTCLRFCWLFRRLIDSADVTDACISTITLGSQVIITRVLHDNLDVQDLCWRAAQLYRLNHDNADVADAVIREADLFRWAVDTLSVTETLARTFIRNRTTTDVTTAVDNAVRLTLLTRLLNDGVAVDERLVAQITYFQQMIGFVLMLLESTEFVVMRLEEEPIDMGVEHLEFIKLEITDL